MFLHSSSNISSRAMAVKARIFLLFLAFLSTLFVISTQQVEIESPLPALAAAEQEAVYRALELINGDVSWRVIFPDDFCVSAPHGVVCDYFFDNTTSSQPNSAHITELNFGYVSDYNSNPPCAANPTLPFWIFSSLPRLRKLFVFNCFNGENQQVSFPDVPVGFGSELEQLVLIDNPSLTGSLSGIVHSFVNLKKLVVTGSGFYGTIPEEVGSLVRLEQLSLSGNKLNGVILGNSFANLTRLKILDLSRNGFVGPLPESMGSFKSLLKLDLSFNRFNGKIPDQIGELSELEFLDLSYNRFVNGVPVMLNKMVKLKEVYLSGNDLGGEIPDIWGKLESLIGLGLSKLGLTGEIPESMAASLKSLSYLGLENNSLEGNVPNGLLSMENLKEINMENNKLSGVIRLRANVTSKRLKLAGNSGLCVDHKSLTGNLSIKSFKLGVKSCGGDHDDASEMPVTVSANILHDHTSGSGCSSSFLLVVFLGMIVILS